ncbi:voltage-gated potassium channel [Roseovarius sp. A-2]|uniref:potassium channel family protein n=1 Tax=Roseovarius sp. A-2 TaxID=1570360 RepID=UPI0009B560C6|nr:potassium channel family protein [Roseovarius sp. A-2]GAW33599.1 voltage-gated potassium channel [Roseovarius sp. A-2]
MHRLKALTLLAMLALMIAGGTVFFRHVEGWSWLDSYFFTVVTLSTVGYGSLVPVTVVGKIGTTVFILAGLGVFAVAIQQFGSFAVRKREEHTEWLFTRLIHHRHAPTSAESTPESEDGASANEDALPP